MSSVRRWGQQPVSASAQRVPRASDGADGDAPNGRDWTIARHLRGRYLLAIDLVGIVAASYLALALRLDQVSAPLLEPAFPIVVGLLLVVRTIVNVRFGLYSRRWRFASVPDLVRIVAAVALGSVVAASIFYVAIRSRRRVAG